MKTFLNLALVCSLLFGYMPNKKDVNLCLINRNIYYYNAPNGRIAGTVFGYGRPIRVEVLEVGKFLKVKLTAKQVVYIHHLSCLRL